MTVEVAKPPDVKWVLFGEADEEAVRHALHESGIYTAVQTAVRGLPASLCEAAGDEVCRAVSDLLALDLADVLIAGWRKHRAMVEAANVTLTQPGSEEIVELASHRITSTHRPRLDVMVDGLKCAELDFELTLTIDIDALCAVIEAGRLTALRVGGADITAELSCESHQIAAGRTHVDLPGCVALGRGVSLVGAPAG